MKVSETPPGELRRSINHRCRLVALGLAALLLASCHTRTKYPVPGELSGPWPSVRETDRLVLLPLRDGSCLPVYGNHVTCHLTGQHLEAADVPDGTGLLLAALLFDNLQARGVSLIPFERGLAILADTDPSEVDAYEPSLAVEVGRRAAATKAIMGVVTRYEQRSGSSYGSREPAAVAFSLALVDVESGAITRKLRFNRRQAPLTTNLFALPIWWQQGFRWWARREVAERSLADAADALLGLESTSPRWTDRPTRPLWTSVTGEGSEWQAPHWDW